MITKYVKYYIPLISFLLCFLYFFFVYDVNFHGPDEPIYYAYTASVVNDGDLNIVNNQTPLNFDQFSVSKTYNFPVFHNYGGVILWAPFYAYAKFVYFIAGKLNITDITLYGHDILARCVMSLSTVVFGITAIFLIYMFCNIFFSAGIALCSIGALLLGTPFFYYLLFEGGNANVVACLFAILSIWFYFYAINFRRLHWFLYGVFFSLCVAVKTELWFQIIFIIPFFLFLVFSKRIVWKKGLYFIEGFVPILILRGINAYLKYGTVHLEEVIYLRSVFHYQLSYCFNGFFSSYRGIFYTSPVLYICLLGFIFVIFRMLKNFRQTNNKEYTHDIFFAMLACYAFVKLALVGKIFSPAGGELSFRVLMTEFPVFVILFAAALTVLKKYTRYLWVMVIVFITWNLIIISEHLTGVEWTYITGVPNILVRVGSLNYILDFLLRINNLSLKLKVCLPLIILIFGTAYYSKMRLSKLISLSSQRTPNLMNVQYLKLFSLFTVCSLVAYLFITVLNIVNNKSNVEKLQAEGFFKNAKIIEVSPLKMTAIEKEQHLITLFKMMRYYAEKGDIDALQHIKEFREKYYGSDESIYSLFPKPVKPYHELAEFYTISGRYKKAINCYKKAIELNPDDGDAFISLGDIHIITGKYEKAIEVYKEAMYHMPDSVNLCQRLADAYDKTGNFKEAIYYYQRYVQLNPRSFYGYAGLGNIYFLRGDYTKAMEYYQKGIKMNLYAIEGYGNLGDIYFIHGEYEKAIKCYQKVIEQVPKSVNVYLNIADAYDKIGSYMKSIDYLKKALEFNPSSANFYEKLGDAYNQIGMHGEAIAAFQKIIDINPQLIEGYESLGDTYFEYGEYEKAIECYQKVIERVPKSVNVYLNIADAYDKIGSYMKSIDYLKKALEFNPSSVDIYFKIADVYDKLGEYKKRIVYLKKALEIAPHSTELYEKLGDAYNKIGMHEEAIAAFQKIIERIPVYSDAYINIAHTYNSMGSYDNAIEYYLQTIRLQPHYAEAYSDLGQIYYDRKEYDKAIYYFKKFIQLNPNDANIYYNLGDVYIGKGDKENVLKQIIKLEELKRNDLVNSLKQEIDLIIEK